MKRIYYVVALALCAISIVGCKSREQKAQALINEYMFKTLYDYESYEVVETKVDSCYSSLFKDAEVRRAALQAKETLEETSEYADEAKRARQTMDIWEGSWSSYSRRRYNEAKEELKTAYLNLTKTYKKHKEYMLFIKNKSIGFEEQFIGWEVQHSFRCKNRGGNFTLGDYMFVIDEKFTQIIDAITYDEDFESIMVYITNAIDCSKEELEDEIASATKRIAELEKL